jgi:hypothetical protein
MKAPIIILMILSPFIGCQPKEADLAARKYAFEWWYANELGENRALSYNGEWIGNGSFQSRYEMVTEKSTGISRNDAGTMKKRIIGWKDRDMSRGENRSRKTMTLTA